MSTDGDRVRWERRTLVSLFCGYAAYYLCRTNLAVANPLLLARYGPEGLTEAHLGLVGSVGYALYAIGKVSNGLLADRWGGRPLFLLGLFASVACTVLFGISSGLLAFAVLWGTNRFFQSMGWVAVVKIASRWFPVHRHGVIMAVLSMSYLLGDAFARLYLGAFITLGERVPVLAFLNDWRSVFLVAAVTTFLVAMALLPWLKSDPTSVGLVEPAASLSNVYGDEGQSAAPVPFAELLGPLVRNAMFWMVCLTNFGLMLVRQTFDFWAPVILYKEAKMTAGSAAIASLVIPLVGALSAYLAGRLSDRLGGRHGRVMVPSIVCLVIALSALAATDLNGRPLVALLLISTVSFFVIAPCSYLNGVIALDVGGKRAGATVAGLSGSAGYAGATLSAAAIGFVAGENSWNAAFWVLAGVSALTLVSGVAYWVLNERSLNRVAKQGAADGG